MTKKISKAEQKKLDKLTADMGNSKITVKPDIDKIEEIITTKGGKSVAISSENKLLSELMKKEGQILGKAFAALNDSFNMLGKDDPIRKKAEKMIKAGKLSIYDIFEQHGKDLVEEINKIELYNECLNGLKGVK